MCEKKDCDCQKRHHRHLHAGHHRHHMQGYSSIVKRTENQITIPEVLLEVADVDVGEFLEISIRKVKKHEKHHH